ncbi:DUF402 domain-containing protein [Sulfoacidibacillus thermotolerans]|uniref:DUF402 domain-containing protein n=1 Tax=Sulfoacidibacillus thermotolerans TaxID=1765684 RepID=A0A2U3DA02_SULT2|nr:DUF402 domain-containing protein [Sulfoacidibacillus thermotolerans]PWI58108.1 hypothetical protein BM613_05445 [Sulfoacidibacillus thermotolerans]
MERELCWRIRSIKYDGSFHRLWTCAYPLQTQQEEQRGDALTFAMWIPAGEKVLEPTGVTWDSPYDVIACFYSSKFYQVMILLKEGKTEYYCNSCTPPEIDITQREVRFVDLDLDLLVDATGTMRVVDQSEFLRNAVEYAYPEEIMLRVQEDLGELQQMAQGRKGVFSINRSEWRRKNLRLSDDADQ